RSRMPRPAIWLRVEWSGGGKTPARRLPGIAKTGHNRRTSRSPGAAILQGIVQVGSRSSNAVWVAITLPYPNTRKKPEKRLTITLKMAVRATWHGGQDLRQVRLFLDRR